MLVTLIISLATYIGMIFLTRYRTAIASLGAGVLLTYGALYFESFPEVAFKNFPAEIFLLILVLSLFTSAFEKTGALTYLVRVFTGLSKHGKRLLIAVALLLIFFLSMFMNNLSVILLFTFIFLELAIKFELPIIPLLVSAIIASNIGGASLPWADTPAVILTLYTDMTLLDFVTKLLLPCVVLILVLIWYTVNQLEKIRFRIRTTANMDFNVKIAALARSKIRKHLEHKGMNLRDVKLILVLFILLIIGICIAPFYNLSIATISLVFGSLLLFLQKTDIAETVNSLPILDSILFISALFLIAGTLEYSGVFKVFINYMLSLTGGNPLLIVLSILFIAFVIATFLSAGPAAATLLPVCQQLAPMVHDKLIYVALALGILSGSSMLPWSATGGPVMLSEVTRFLKSFRTTKEEQKQIEEIFSLKQYVAFSIPFSLIILVFGGIFLFIYV